MHCLSSIYSVITPLYVSGASAAHHQKVEYIYVADVQLRLSAGQAC
jgi:hypothetical protein